MPIQPEQPDLNVFYFNDDFRTVPDMLAEDEPPEPSVKAIDLIIKGASIVVVETGTNKWKIVVFKPSKATITSVQNYVHQNVDLMLDDACGLFSPHMPQTIVGSTYQSRNDVLMVNVVRRSDV